MNLTRNSRLITLAAVIVVVAALYFAKVILVPFAIAFLLAFLLSPLVNRVHKLGLPRIPAVIVVIVFRAVVQVEEVRVTGNLGLDREALRRAVPQRESEPLSEEAILRGVYAIQELYEDNGYFRARVRAVSSASSWLQLLR